MKKKSLALIMTLPLYASAQDLKLRDIWYVAPVGTFGGSTTAGYQQSTTTTAGTNTDATTFGADQEFNYWAAENLKVAIGVGYASTNIDATGAKDQSGITDPSVAASYRSLLSAENNLFLRSSLALSPSVGEATASNQLRGSHKVTATAVVGQNLAPIEYSAGLLLAYSTDSDDTRYGDAKSKFDYGFLADAQYDFTEMVAADLGISLIFPGDVEYKTAGAATLTTDYILNVSAGPSFQFRDDIALNVKASYQTAPGDTDTDGFGAVAALEYNFN